LFAAAHIEQKSDQVTTETFRGVFLHEVHYQDQLLLAQAESARVAFCDFFYPRDILLQVKETYGDETSLADRIIFYVAFLFSAFHIVDVFQILAVKIFVQTDLFVTELSIELNLPVHEYYEMFD